MSPRVEWTLRQRVSQSFSPSHLLKQEQQHCSCCFMLPGRKASFTGTLHFAFFYYSASQWSSYPSSAIFSLPFNGSAADGKLLPSLTKRGGGSKTEGDTVYFCPALFDSWWRRQCFSFHWFSLPFTFFSVLAKTTLNTFYDQRPCFFEFAQTTFSWLFLSPLLNKCSRLN